MDREFYEKKYENIWKSKDGVKDKIVEFLFENPNPPDKKIHALSEKMGINPHKFEAIIYSILSEVIHKPTKKEAEVDAGELKMGIEVEKEHTSVSELAKYIALAHLSELPDYYTRLKKMESKK